MNIFVLDADPNKAAQMQCDKHVVKMILETAQLLCTAAIMTGGKGHYKATHKNHPCSLWTRESKANFGWLKQHGLALCREYTLRYGKKHKSESVIQEVLDQTIPNGELTPFKLAMPDECKIYDDPVECYRHYYRTHKAEIAKWAHSSKPEWW